jgi:hypothetical protein
VRRGYVADPPTTAAIDPIEFEYEDEEAIVDPLARLDELGDLVDGTMPDDELDGWISRLSS